MHIDYLALMLVNFTAGLALLACWIYLDAGRPAEKRWIPGFAVCGLLALILGLNMVFNWPLPGVQNALYGGMSVLFGTLLLGLVLVVWFESDLLPLAVFAAIAGLASLIAGIQVIRLGAVPSPVLIGAGFIWLGVTGLGAVPMMRLRGAYAFNVFGAVALLVALVIWGIIGYKACWERLEPALKWNPPRREEPVAAVGHPATPPPHSLSAVSPF